MIITKLGEPIYTNEYTSYMIGYKIFFCTYFIEIG